MELTDKEYLTLAFMEPSVLREGTAGMTVRDLLGGEPAEAGAAAGSGGMYGLKLADRWIAPEAEGYAFRNENDDRWLIFLYTAEFSLNALKGLLSGENALLKQSVEFRNTAGGSGRLAVTGFGLGGALALFAAGSSGGAAAGVVFDAPGVSHLLPEEGALLSGIRNIAAPGSAGTALGTHGETLEFALPEGGAGRKAGPEAALLGQPDQSAYRTDDAGRVLTGRPDETYALLAHLGVLLEEGPAVRAVAEAFIRAAGLANSGARELVHALVPLTERADLQGIREALLEIAAGYDREVQQIWTAWKRDLSEDARKLGPTELSELFESRSEAAMREASERLEDLIRVTEAFLVVLVLLEPEHGRLADRLEDLVETVTGGMTARLKLLSRQMPEELAGLMEQSMSRMFVWPDLQFAPRLP
ncbi:hypothetical protein [Paenibacillus glufosinatiresistens]|uniref:hypothetical protein n=1 Tax=Paenibacillus glufosinatiresistens TaxID=3070657 RepID=UPI00286DA38A|nr:hypothetical protein [Paenibacillus sp. YX.27]